LELHDDDSSVRAQYLTFLQDLPETFDDHRKQAVADTAKWLARHDENSHVRAQYLTFLQGLPETFAGHRKQALADTAKWVRDHDDNSEVRTQYLTFLQGLPGTFDEQRTQAVGDTAKWLARHDDDSGVRTQYLTFVQGLPDGFDKERADAAQTTSAWLERHPNSHTVLGRYVSFLLDVPLAALEPLRQSSDKHHRRLIAKNPDNFGHNYVYAEQLLRLSRFDEAIAQYDVVLKRHKGHQMARRGRAFALQKLGRMPEAEAEFKHAIWWAGTQGESDAIFHTSLGEFYLESRRWPDAVNSFLQAQEGFPDHYINHWGIAKAQVGLENFDKAEDALRRALEDPNLKPPAKDEIVQFLDDVRVGRSS
jgi:tetratricopeptide (TPR) repeat protein